MPPKKPKALESHIIIDPSNPTNYIISLSTEDQNTSTVIFSMPVLALDDTSATPDHILSSRRMAISQNPQAIQLAEEEYSNTKIQNDPQNILCDINNFHFSFPGDIPPQHILKFNSLKVFEIITTTTSLQAKKDENNKKLSLIFQAAKEHIIQLDINYFDDKLKIGFLSASILHGYLSLIDTLLELNITVKKDDVRLALSQGLDTFYYEKISAYFAKYHEIDTSLGLTGNHISYSE